VRVSVKLLPRKGHAEESKTGAWGLGMVLTFGWCHFFYKHRTPCSASAVLKGSTLVSSLSAGEIDHCVPDFFDPGVLSCVPKTPPVSSALSLSAQVVLLER
jgi:hypothetical protein